MKPRSRNYQRIYKACEWCRKKKTRCLVDDKHRDTIGAPCIKCRRESRQCSFSMASDGSEPQRQSIPNGDQNRTSANARKDNHPPARNEVPFPRHAHERNSRRSEVSTSPHPRTGGSTDGSRSSGPFRTSVSHGSPDASSFDVARRIPNFGGNTTNAAAEAPPPPLRDTIMRTTVSRNEDAMRLLAQSARPNMGDAATTNPQWIQPLPMVEMALSQPQPSILRLWESFRFVRMGWLTATEAVSYIDLFFKNLGPLSPVVDEFYQDHQNHYHLITQEPLLCCTLLTISCRYHNLRGGGGLSRNIMLHQRLWDHCQHLISRIVFGQEKRSKAKTRTFRSIQALIILTEWYPRATQFPPESDGWDSSLIFLMPDDRDGPDDNQALENTDIPTKWQEEVVSPAKLGDRMSWMFLGLAMSLGHELGVFQPRGTERPSTETSTAGVEPKHRDAANYPWMRKILHIADHQFAARLSCTSMVPSSLDMVVSDPLTPDDAPPCVDTGVVNSWFRLAQIARSIYGTVFPSTAVTFQLIQSHAYVNAVKHFQEQLWNWRQTNLDVLDMASQNRAYESLASEYHYNCIMLNSLGLQAVVDRAFSPGGKQATTNSSQRSVPTTSVQLCITPVDYGLIQQVTDSSCHVLRGLIRLAQAGTLSYCPMRVLLRAITASIFLLKALSMGAPASRLGESLDILQQAIDALRRDTWEDMHLASRYAALLDMHLAQMRSSFVVGVAPNGISITPFGSGDGLSAFDSSGIGLYSSTAQQSGLDEWMSLPLDVSMAPFGVSGLNESDTFPNHAEGDWDFLWGLPFVQQM